MVDIVYTPVHVCGGFEIQKSHTILNVSGKSQSIICDIVYLSFYQNIYLLFPNENPITFLTIDWQKAKMFLKRKLNYILRYCKMCNNNINNCIV